MSARRRVVGDVELPHSPEQIAYELITGCPGCSADITEDDLCEHDDPTTGPLCATCCALEHRTRQPWEVAA